jgi:hypothetical protein
MLPLFPLRAPVFAAGVPIFSAFGRLLVWRFKFEPDVDGLSRGSGQSRCHIAGMKKARRLRRRSEALGPINGLQRLDRDGRPPAGKTGIAQCLRME